MAQNLVTNIRRAAWIPTWNSIGLGYTDDVKPDIKEMYEDIKVGTIGKATLGKRFVGIEGTITIKVREVTLAIIQDLMPWGVDGGGAYVLNPPVNTDIYTYAQLLNLQPTDNAAASDHTQDLNLMKTVPLMVPNAMERKGTEDDVWEIMFGIFPNRAMLPRLVYGYIGATAAT